MNNRELLEYAERIRRELHELIDQKIDNFMMCLENGELTAAPEREVSLSTAPSYFKGKKPVSLLFPDGREIYVPSWKNAVFHLMQNCAEDEKMHERLEEIRGKVFGRNRLLFGSSGDGMDIPLEFSPDMFLETKFDTEALLTVVTKRIFAPIGYDYSGIRLKVIDPALKISAVKMSAESAQEDVGESALEETALEKDSLEEEPLEEGISEKQGIALMM